MTPRRVSVRCRPPLKRRKESYCEYCRAYGQGCLLRDYVPEEYKEEAFPCQHLNESAVERLVTVPELSARVADRLVSIAEELEASAHAEDFSNEHQGYP